MNRIFIILVLLIVAIPSSGQRILQIEKKNSVKAIKFITTDHIQLKLKDEKKWVKGVIYDFNEENEFIELEHRIVFLKDIEYIRMGYKAKGSALARQVASNTFSSFGISWGIFSLIDAAASDERSFDERDTYITFGSIALGYLTTKLFSSRKYKIGDKWKFRMLNLDIIPVLETTHPEP